MFFFFFVFLILMDDDDDLFLGCRRQSFRITSNNGRSSNRSITTTIIWAARQVRQRDRLVLHQGLAAVEAPRCLPTTRNNILIQHRPRNSRPPSISSRRSLDNRRALSSTRPIYRRRNSTRAPRRQHLLHQTTVTTSIPRIWR